MTNLFDNALKYASKKVEVSMDTSDATNESYRIIFKNDGWLVPYELRETIFQSFVRANETARLSGTGIV